MFSWNKLASLASTGNLNALFIIFLMTLLVAQTIYCLWQDVCD
jgi:hypothetical protein